MNFPKTLFQRKRHRNGTCQITMTYRREDHERHGDEIMVLQDNIIVFKGFLQPEGKFEKFIIEKEIVGFVCRIIYFAISTTSSSIEC